MPNPEPINKVTRMDGAFPSVAAKTTTGAGTNFAFSVPTKDISMQVAFAGGAANVKVNLEGTIDWVNWFPLTVFDTAANNVSGDIVGASTLVVAGVRANVITLDAGNVTATILARGGQG